MFCKRKKIIYIDQDKKAEINRREETSLEFTEIRGTL